MKHIKLILLLAVSVAMFACQSGTVDSPLDQDHLKLWYKKPAEASTGYSGDAYDAWTSDPQWLRALPLGNGSLGAMVYGDVNIGRIQLSEKSLWSGSPQNSNNPAAFAALDDIRRLLFAGKYRKATKLTNRTQVPLGKGSGHGTGAKIPYGSFQTLGDLWIDTGHRESYDYKNYYRELDLEEAIVRIRYTQDGVRYKREIFVSYPDQVMAARFSADRPGSISMTLSLTRPERYRTFTKNEQLIMAGALTDGTGGEGLRYMVRLKALAKNGRIRYTDSTIVITDADRVTLFLTAATDYVLEYPDYCCKPYKQITRQTIKEAVEKGYRAIRADHIRDYQQYFQRVELDITPAKVKPVPTNKRVATYSRQDTDAWLEQLMFQYGRYLLIASSRQGSLPANLQGLWTNKIQTPWSGDYHLDINLQMNYWPAGIANLPEMAMPLFDFMESLAEAGRKTAKIQYHSDGWVVHTITNVWGYTAPGEAASWGMYPGAGAWLATHIREHYAFTGDTTFLQRMYPVLEGAVQFYMDWLVEHPRTGKLVAGPAVSPENTFIADGSYHQVSMGPSHSQQVIYQLFTDFIVASKVLNIHSDLVGQVTQARQQLARPEIAPDGRLMEWAKDFKEAEPGHRHFSHLFALYPGHQISPEETPKLAKAARAAINYRVKHGGGGTAWSKAWLISLYAQLHKEEKAYRFLSLILAKHTAPNLLTTIGPVSQLPPFQIETNFGLTAGVAMMFLQSTYDGEIQLLPALPADQWPTGSVEGLRARGGFVVDIQWQEGTLSKAQITSLQGRACRIRTNIPVQLKQMDVQSIPTENGYILTLNTQKGQTYTLIPK